MSRALPQEMDLHIASYNIHKGFSYFNRRMVVHELRDRLRAVDADIVFLQEVQGEHAGHARQFHNWPGEPQYEFLADAVGGSERGIAELERGVRLGLGG